MIDFELLKNYDSILFGPFVGEFGWEVSRWSGFILSFKNKFPKIKVFVSTRVSSCDLYENYADDMYLFDINGDYDKYIPSCYSNLNLPQPVLEKLYKGALNKFGGYNHCLNPLSLGYNMDMFDMKDMCFDYKPRDTNGVIIKRIIDENDIENKKTIICSVSRNRNETDVSGRNWGIGNWTLFFDRINRRDDILCFNLGREGTYVKAPKEFKNIINLSEYIDEKNKMNVSDVGLTIEAIRKSCLTFGTQSANIILSNLLRTPTLFIGDEIDRHSLYENPYRTMSFGINAVPNNYNKVDISNVMNEFDRVLNGIKNLKNLKPVTISKSGGKFEPKTFY